MRERFPTRSAFRAGVLVLAALVPLLIAVNVQDLPPPVTILVGDRIAYVKQETTFGDAVHGFGLRPQAGRLLDVEGKVLEYRAYPGRVLLNGEEAPHATELADGDRIEVVDGEDRTEGTKKVTTPVKGRQPGNPQYTLATGPVVQVTTEGRISHKVVAIVYRPIGKAKRPPEVALTFDDGPWPGTTRKILAILERMHVKATFFVVGSLVERYPGIVRDEVEAGMTIGNHSYLHPISPAFDRLPPHRIEEEMAKTSELLKERFGVKPYLFRAPGGSWTDEMIQTARTFGMRLVQWDVDPADWLSSATKESITRNVLALVRPGSIVDLHDGGGDQSATIAALPAIIRGIRKMGLKLVAIPR